MKRLLKLFRLVRNKYYSLCALGFIDRIRYIGKYLHLSFIAENIIFLYFKFVIFLSAFHGPSKCKVIFSCDKEKIFSDKIPVFCLWLQGFDSAPEIVKLCRASLRRHFSEADYELIELDNENLSNYIALPINISSKLCSSNYEIAHLSDYIRTKLVYEYGGIWIDSTMFFSAPLPKEILEVDFFVFKLSDEHVQIASNQFIYAKCPGNPLLGRVLWNYEVYLEFTSSPHSYYFYHYVFAISAREISYNLFQTSRAYLSSDNHVLHLQLLQDVKVDRLAELFVTSFVHKLSHKSTDSAGYRDLINYLGSL